MTKFYITSQETPVLPAAIRGAWDETVLGRTRLLGTAASGVHKVVVSDKTDATNNWDQLLYRGVSAPLSAQTISGTFDVILGVVENISATNAHFHIHAYVMAPDGSVRGTLLTDYTEPAGTNEWLTTATGTNLNAAQTLSSVSATAGDRLVVEIGVVQRNTNTSSVSASLHYGGTGGDLTDGSTSVTTLAGYVEFSGTITTTAETATRTTFYLTNAAADYDPAAVAGSWDDTAAKVVKGLEKTKSGAHATVSRAETSVSADWDVLLYQGISQALAAQTIDGDIDVVFGRISNSGNTARFCTHVHVWVTQGNSATPRGTLLADYAIAINDDNWDSGDDMGEFFAPVPLSSLAVTAGDRLVVEIGFKARNTSATSFTGAIDYGGTAGDLTPGTDPADANTKSGTVTFSDAIVLASEVAGYAHSQCVIVG